MNKSFWCALLLFLATYDYVKGQDFHFSSEMPIQQNPAMTGFMDSYQSRLMVKHRNQWSALLGDAAFKTYAASFETRVCSTNFWGIGGFIMSDQSGSPAFNTTQGLLSISYHRNLGKQTYLAAGLNTGFINYKVNDNLAFATQFDGDVGFDLTQSNFEDLSDFQANLLDLGLGLLLYENDANYKWYVGLALQHINTSNAYTFKQNNLQNPINLRMKKTVHWGIARIFKNAVNELAFKGTFQWQAPHWESVLGLYLQLQNLNIGFGTRLTKNQPRELVPPLMDAFILSFDYQFDQLNIGFSYDLNTSPLRTSTNYRGAFELTATYVFGATSHCVYCPSF